VNLLTRNTTGMSRLVWTAGISVGASLPHWPSLPIWAPALLLACVGWRFAARIIRVPLPGRKLMWLATIGAFGAVFYEFGTINGLVPGTALLVVMVSLKFLEARSQRDHMLLTVIAYFLVFASLLAGGGPIKGLYLFVFAWITTLGLLQVGRQGPLLPNLPSARLAGRLLLQSLPIMIVLFVLFPRLPGPLWAIPGAPGSGTSGLSGSMSPGDITELGLSDEIAFRVEFMGQTPAASELYWRGPVLPLFDGRTWNRLQGTRGTVSDTIEYLGQTSEYRVMLDTAGRNWAFAIDMPESWSTGDRRQSIRMNSEYQLNVFPPGANQGRLSYTVTSHSQYRAAEPLTENEIALFTRLPPGGNPRTRELVAAFADDAPDARTIVERGLDVFRQPDFFYTLTPPPLGVNSADDFIFETKEGFCEHYASAFAIMMRMAGLPARVVTGYQGGELNSIGDYYVIRQSDAHAWTEVWTPEDGWVRVDPVSAVAPERIALGSSRTSIDGPATVTTRLGRLPWLRQAALAWDAVNTFWDDRIVGYGPRLQRLLLERLGFERPDWRELLALTVAATVILMVALTAYLGLKVRETIVPDPSARCFGRFMRKLRRLEVEPMQAGETPTAYARRAGNRLPDQVEAIQNITTAYLCARYEPDSDGKASAQLRALVKAFRSGYAPASP
jgi:transglutaminase-like putative cysteine protease